MKRISPRMRFRMNNPFLQFFKFIILSIKIMVIVTRGHGGTRETEKAA